VPDTGMVQGAYHRHDYAADKLLAKDSMRQSESEQQLVTPEDRLTQKWKALACHTHMPVHDMSTPLSPAQLTSRAGSLRPVRRRLARRAWRRHHSRSKRSLCCAGRLGTSARARMLASSAMDTSGTG